MDKEILGLVSKFLEGQEQNSKHRDVINLNLQVSSTELKELGELLNKLRSQNG